MAKKKTYSIKVREKDLEKSHERARPLKKIKLEVNTERVEESIRQAVERLQYWYKQGMIHKVRLKYRGKAILPDIPLSYFMLAQVATFFLTGVVRALAISLGTRIFFEVEMINDAEELVKRARELYLNGELEEAAQLLEDALDLDKNYAEAYLYLGIIHKIKGDPESATRFFLQAQKLDPAGKSGIEASKNLKKLASPKP
jgi:tetratricopeptide (TPR) repeat protein